MTWGSVVAAAQPWQGRGQVQGPGVFMFGRPPQALSRQSGQLPNGTFPARRGRTGIPVWARCRAVLRVWGMLVVLLSLQG